MGKYSMTGCFISVSVLANLLEMAPFAENNGGFVVNILQFVYNFVKNTRKSCRIETKLINLCTFNKYV